MYFNVDLELKLVFRYNILVCITMNEQAVHECDLVACLDNQN